MKYQFTVTKTYHYFGYPEAEYHFDVKGEYFTAKIRYYGNHGFDVPQITCPRRNNGYFWSSRKFIKALYADELRSYFLNLRENESITFTLE